MRSHLHDITPLDQFHVEYISTIKPISFEITSNPYDIVPLDQSHVEAMRNI